jgi:hypothetical protein
MFAMVSRFSEPAWHNVHVMGCSHNAKTMRRGKTSGRDGFGLHVREQMLNCQSKTTRTAINTHSLVTNSERTHAYGTVDNGSVNVIEEFETCRSPSGFHGS